MFSYLFEPLFNSINLNANGLITAKESEKALTIIDKAFGVNFDEDHKVLIKELDKHGNGNVDFKEFKNLFFE